MNPPSHPPPGPYPGPGRYGPPGPGPAPQVRPPGPGAVPPGPDPRWPGGDRGARPGPVDPRTAGRVPVPPGPPPGFPGPPPPPHPAAGLGLGGPRDPRRDDGPETLPVVYEGPPPPPPARANRPAETPPPAGERGPAPERARSPHAGRIAKVVGLVVLLVVVAGVALWLQSSSPSSAKVGDCIKINDVAQADIDKVDCAAEDALYKVAVTTEDPEAGCPSPAYLAYSETGRNELLLCLALNAEEGECFQATPQSHRKVDCGSPDAMFRVSQVIPGTDDASRCGRSADNALTYPDPPLTICRVAPDVAAT